MNKKPPGLYMKPSSSTVKRLRKCIRHLLTGQGNNECCVQSLNVFKVLYTLWWSPFHKALWWPIISLQWLSLHNTYVKYTIHIHHRMWTKCRGCCESEGYTAVPMHQWWPLETKFINPREPGQGRTASRTAKQFARVLSRDFWIILSKLCLNI